MLIEKKAIRRSKLSWEILGLLAASLLVSVFLFQFLSVCAVGISENYYFWRGMILTDEQLHDLDNWIFSLSLIISVGFFLVLFLVLLGERLSYIRKIIKGVDTLQSEGLQHKLPLEGNNELTQLAEAINYMSATQQKIKEKEQKLNEEKEEFIRTLSHDIRTPLTTIMSYSELAVSGKIDSPEEWKNCMTLIQKKAAQIKDLTDILLDGGKREPEYFEDARLLMEQLAGEFEEVLEDEFRVEVDLSECLAVSGTFDVKELGRILDNLISNVQKYADREQTVKFGIRMDETGVVIRQSNAKGHRNAHTESYRMGINSIRRIAHNYGGHVTVQEDDDVFEIRITLLDD